MEKVCDLCHVTLNKNTVVGDVNAISPGGVRIGEVLQGVIRGHEGVQEHRRGGRQRNRPGVGEAWSISPVGGVLVMRQ